MMTARTKNQNSGPPQLPEGAYAHGQGSFFGRRKGHKLRSHQAGLMDTLLPQLTVDITQPVPDDIRTLFPVEVDQVRLEIGFGGGEHLVAEALAHPRTGFIGCEPYINGMAKILAAIDAHGIRNIRLVAGDAAELLAWVPENAFARVDLIHPDPWPKRRHWKRRFVQDETLIALSRVLPSKGEFRFVCDIEDYVTWTLSHVMRAPDFMWTAEQAVDWQEPWPNYTMTRFGMKAKREGRKAAYLIFRRL